LVNNFYILKEFSSYLDSELAGCVFSESFSQEKNKLIIILSRSNPINDIKYLEFSCSRRIPFLVLRGSYTKAKNNYAELFRECVGKEITRVDLFNDDRLIRILFSDNTFFIFNFIPYKFNALFVKESYVICSFKSNEELRNKNLNMLFPKIVKSRDERILTCKTFLKNLDNKLDELYIQEILKKSMLDVNAEYRIQYEDEILKNYNNLINNIKNPKYLLYKTGERFFISLTKLSVMNNAIYEEFPDVNSMIEKYVREIMKYNSTEETKSKLISEITKKIKHLEQKRKNLAMQKNNASNYQLMRDYGNTILSNMGRINHGDSHYNYIDENRNINYFITLDTKLTPSQNAQKYFDKYKRQKESLNLLDNKISSVENELMRLREKLNKAERMDNFKELKTEVKKEISEKDETESKHFRKFILSENFQVWVGKNASSNDLLTFKYSNQNDLWFHIRGFSGSHTVLKKSSKNLEFPKEIIKIAASIAAYYSKARNSGTIPVAYTERKYVKKGKGLKAGSVIMDREKVVFVKPGLPFE
jgi:predicted ribosome quality control (RQC) complex YloA/Tae2 family protein